MQWFAVAGRNYSSERDRFGVSFHSNVLVIGGRVAVMSVEIAGLTIGETWEHASKWMAECGIEIKKLDT